MLVVVKSIPNNVTQLLTNGGTSIFPFIKGKALELQAWLNEPQQKTQECIKTNEEDKSQGTIKQQKVNTSINTVDALLLFQ